MEHVEIELKFGLKLLIDESDLHIYNSQKWHLLRARMKAVKYYLICSSNRKSYYLHRLIMNAQKGKLIDHINGNTLDCRRLNLRSVTATENRLNAKAAITGKSKYKGVFVQNGRKKRYYSMIGRKGKPKKWIGSFYTEKVAHAAYEEMLIKLGLMR